ncbi:MAG: prepilin-type N-terminal cleavage/methylation domain-containing protein [Neisseriaceae bacterium]|nr:prepilin-type N-terminal cleavage/methylation domain-containing protein [Neisseriaceae bacterium]
MLSKKQHGFTLTELMIVVAVLAILAGIAIPSYSHFTKKAQLRKAQSALLENAHALEQVYAQNKKFADAAGKGIIDDTKYKVGEVDGKGGRLFSEVPGNKFKITTTYTGTDKYEIKQKPMVLGQIVKNAI